MLLLNLRIMQSLVHKAQRKVALQYLPQFGSSYFPIILHSWFQSTSHSTIASLWAVQESNPGFRKLLILEHLLGQKKNSYHTSCWLKPVQKSKSLLAYFANAVWSWQWGGMQNDPYNTNNDCNSSHVFNKNSCFNVLAHLDCHRTMKEEEHGKFHPKNQRNLYRASVAQAFRNLLHTAKDTSVWCKR